MAKREWLVMRELLLDEFNEKTFPEVLDNVAAG